VEKVTSLLEIKLWQQIKLKTKKNVIKGTQFQTFSHSQQKDLNQILEAKCIICVITVSAFNAAVPFREQQ
jgi:hypothetical protein